MSWSFNSSTPLFIQIADRIRADILNGKYAPDTQIPTVRQLAFDASVNPNTMQKALISLEEEGLLYTKGTVGRFVTSDPCVLTEAQKKLKKTVMSKIVSEALDAGITKDELIEFLRTEEQL